MGHGILTSRRGQGGWTEGSLACTPDPAYLWDDYAAVLPVWPHETRHPDLREGVGEMDRRQLSGPHPDPGHTSQSIYHVIRVGNMFLIHLQSQRF
jgi:hypothetical protein